MAHPTG